MTENIKIEGTHDREEKLASQLKELGVEDEETKKQLIEWTKDQERQADEFEDGALGRIRLNLNRARLYFAAGFYEEAFENYDDAWTQADNEGREEIKQKIDEEMQRKLSIANS